jgi:chromosome segregation ATPase
MSDLESFKLENEKLKKENESLKIQMANNNQGMNNFANQLDAYKGELTDARTISFQLRMSLGNAINTNQAMAERMKVLEAQIEKMKKEKTDSVPVKDLESKQNKP